MSRGQRDPKWTPAQDAELKKQLGKGASFAIAAAAINAEFGTSYSRNSAIGRAHRLGLCKASFIPKEQRRKPTTTVVRRVTRVVRANGNSDKMRFLECPETDAAPLRCVEVVPLNLPLLDLAHNGCRYPYGDGPFVFCGHPQIEGSNYCMPHWSLTFAHRRSTNEAATENRRRNFRKQYQKHLLEQQNETSNHPRSHRSQGRSAQGIIAQVP